MTETEDKLNALFNKIMKASPKEKKKKDPIVEAMKEGLAKAKKEHDKKVPKKFQNGSGYEYTKVWNEKTNDFDYVSTARVRMAEYLGRPLEKEERVYFFDRKIKGEAKYAQENLILGDQSGPFLTELVCKCCGTKGSLQGSHMIKSSGADSSQEPTYSL